MSVIHFFRSAELSVFGSVVYNFSRGTWNAVIAFTFCNKCYFCVKLLNCGGRWLILKNLCYLSLSRTYLHGRENSTRQLTLYCLKAGNLTCWSWKTKMREKNIHSRSDGIVLPLLFHMPKFCIAWIDVNAFKLIFSGSADVHYLVHGVRFTLKMTTFLCDGRHMQVHTNARLMYRTNRPIWTNSGMELLAAARLRAFSSVWKLSTQTHYWLANCPDYKLFSGTKPWCNPGEDLYLVTQFNS